MPFSNIPVTAEHCCSLQKPQAMVKKVLVKHGGGTGLDDTAGSSQQVLATTCTGGASNYEISYIANPDNYLQNVVEAKSVNNGGELEDVQDIQLLASNDVVCTSHVLTEQEVEVAAYATLSVTNSRARAAHTAAPDAWCPLGCEAVISSEKHLRQHLEEAHLTPVGKKVKLFPSMGKFLAWKEARERESCRRYVVREKRNGWRRFACSRSGQPSGSGQRPRRKRTGSYCPAFLRSSTLSDGSVKLRYSLFHTCTEPDNTPLQSDRELAKASEQLHLLERAVEESMTRRRRRRRTEPGDELLDPGEHGPEPEPVPEPDMEPEPEPDESSLIALTPAASSANPPAGHQQQPENHGERDPASERVSEPVLGPTAADRRKTSALSAPAAPPADGDEGGVRQRVRTNLLRLHAKLERSSPEEARSMLADTEELLERYARIQQRGTSGKLLGRRRPAGTAEQDSETGLHCSATTVRGVWGARILRPRGRGRGRGRRGTGQWGTAGDSTVNGRIGDGATTWQVKREASAADRGAPLVTEEQQTTSEPMDEGAVLEMVGGDVLQIGEGRVLRIGPSGELHLDSDDVLQVGAEEVLEAQVGAEEVLEADVQELLQLGTDQEVVFRVGSSGQTQRLRVVRSVPSGARHT